MSGPCFDPGHAVAAFAGVPVTKPRYDVVEDVLCERHEQDVKWGEQNHPDGTGGERARVRAEVAKLKTDHAALEGRVTWHDILAEEVFEALAEDEPYGLRAELVQVAAVAVAWIESLDRRSES